MLATFISILLVSIGASTLIGINLILGLLIGKIVLRIIK